jgi:phosphate transport system substrate-binding protein
VLGRDASGDSQRHKGDRNLMKKAIVMVIAAGMLVVVAVIGGTATAAPKRSTSTVVGTGSTFVFPLVSKWIPEVGKALGTDLTYSPTGSGAGIAAVTARTVDFGASDAPLTPDQATKCNGCVQVPIALSAMSVPYNVPGIGNCVLRLTPQTLSAIYLGEIANWNAPALKADNPKCNFPDLKITPVYRSDGSGSTWAFSNYLSAVSPAWKSKVGVGTAVNWPAGVGARGSSGVAGVVTKTAGSLTYVDVAYAKNNKLRFAWIKNRAGKFASPGLRGIQAAVTSLPKTITSVDQLGNLSDPPASAGRLAYPIGAFTYAIVPTKTSKATELRKLVYWEVTVGQKFGPPLIFQPLPKQVQAFAYREIKKIQS